MHNNVYILGFSKEIKKKILRKGVKSAHLVAGGYLYYIPPYVIATALKRQVDNDLNSLNMWEKEHKDLFLTTFKKYINAGGSIKEISKVIGIWPQTLTSWIEKSRK